MITDLALVDQALLVRVHELDRILDRDDVCGTARVDVVDHRRQGRRLTRTGRARDQDQARVHVADPLAHLDRHAQVLEGRDAARDRAHHRRHRALLVEDVRAEAPVSLQAEGAVQLQVPIELRDLVRSQDAGREPARLVRSERRVLHGQQDSVHADARRSSDGDVQSYTLHVRATRTSILLSQCWREFRVIVAFRLGNLLP